MEKKKKRVGIDKRVKVFTKGGEKKVVEQMVRQCMRDLSRVQVLENSLENPAERESGERRREKRRIGLKPVIETKSMKRSGMAHQVPTPVTDRRGLYRACNWIREATLKRAKKRGVPVGDARRIEMRAMYDEFRMREKGRERQNFTSIPMQIRDRTHRSAKANRVFASGR